MSNDGTLHQVRVTVSGSFRKHWTDIDAVRKKLIERGGKVMSPVNGPPVLENDGFVFLRSDVGSPDDLERGHLSAIRKSDLLYIVNPEGYLGNSVALEIGYALAWDVPIWSSETFAESPQRELVRAGSIEEALEVVGRRMDETTLDEEASLASLQAQVRTVAATRGFDKERPEDVFVLLVEEIGELATALRARMRLLMSEDDEPDKTVRLELADCLIYILHMANQTGINLTSALREKERINSTKKWYAP